MFITKWIHFVQFFTMPSLNLKSADLYEFIEHIGDPYPTLNLLGLEAFFLMRVWCPSNGKLHSS